jgi:hypothetical protein
MINMMMYPQCLCCKRYWDFLNENPQFNESQLDRCYAFPEGIPDEINNSRFNHRFEYPGDNGLGFEPVDEIGDGLQSGNFIHDMIQVNVKYSRGEIMEMMRKRQEERYGKSGHVIISVDASCPTLP